MAKKRTTLPFYTKAMARVMSNAQHYADANLSVIAARNVRYVRIKRALAHMQVHSWPRPLSGIDYGSIYPPLGAMARFL